MKSDNLQQTVLRDTVAGELRIISNFVAERTAVCSDQEVKFLDKFSTTAIKMLAEHYGLEISEMIEMLGYPDEIEVRK